MDGYLIVNILSALMIITSLMVLLSKSPVRATIYYGIQALILVGLLIAMGFTTGYPELFEWSVTSIFTKVIFAPACIFVALHFMKKLGIYGNGAGDARSATGARDAKSADDVSANSKTVAATDASAKTNVGGESTVQGLPHAPSTIKPWVAVLLVIVEVALCFFAVEGIDLPTAQPVKPTLAISLALFFVGLTCIISQRNIIKEILGYCLLENGSHVTMAVLSPGAPSLVEVGVTTDAIFGTVILCILAYRIYKKIHSIDANDLMELKG